MYTKKPIQQSLFEESISLPSTRYQGSKRKLINWIWSHIKDLKFDSFFDAFGGTGIVGYKMKIEDKEVIYNDILKSNYIIAKSIIENNEVTLEEDDINFILNPHEAVNCKTVIQDNFKDIYFLDEENKWLDMVVQNIHHMKNEYKQAIAFNSLFQSCIIKRPFNLFHRKNLYMRTDEDVDRSFGNKVTWDTPFKEHFLNFVSEINQCVYDNCRNNKVMNLDVLEIKDWVQYDMVYIDTPYTSEKGNTVDYRNFYHFLEGIVDYYNWEDKIDFSVKHNRLKPVYNIWNDPDRIKEAYKKLFALIKSPFLVMSYRSDGIPSKDWFYSNLKDKYKSVDILIYGDYQYVLSNNKKSKEILVIARDIK